MECSIETSIFKVNFKLHIIGLPINHYTDDISYVDNILGRKILLKSIQINNCIMCNGTIDSYWQNIVIKKQYFTHKLAIDYNDDDKCNRIS